MCVCVCGGVPIWVHVSVVSVIVNNLCIWIDIDFVYPCIALLPRLLPI